MRLPGLALLVMVGLIVAACSSGGGATAAPSATASSGQAAAPRVEVQLTDALRIEPATMRVPAGVPVTFVVTNVGVAEHEFYLGDEAAQAEHEQEMSDMGMAHDEEMGIAVAPGETKELTVTFPEAGSILAGCHEPGHYGGGMVATVEIVG